MNRFLRAVLPGLVLAGIGAAAIRLALLGEMNDYVKPSMRPWVIVAGGVLLLVGLASQWYIDVLEGEPEPLAAGAGHHEHETADVEHGCEHDEHHEHGAAGHDHRRGPTIGLLLILPVVVFIVIRPGPLTTTLPLLGSSDGWSGPSLDTDEVPTEAYVGRGASPETVEALAVEVPLDRYIRGFTTGPRALDGLAVRMLGQIERLDGATPSLVRFKVFCCAADGLRLDLPLAGTDFPADGTWVEVAGVWDGVDPLAPVLEVATVTEVEEPELPYLF